ncbi:hypothetical protein JB92DRAFT_3156078 [Gautieria morchelliformis]|nr:hypothetical protein JB92DRAFT_3156078 [Gautieria morchelliformis]
MIGLNDKVTRGFKHPQIARLICPVSWLEDFDQDPEFRQKLADGKHIPHPHDWPLLLFDEATFDITNLCASFLRNEMLVRAWRMIFQGPSAVDGHTSNKATKRGNALHHGVKSVTVNALAYIATLVYFALSSQEVFSAGGGDNEFDYYEFYRGLVATLEEEFSAKDRSQVIEWWNRYELRYLLVRKAVLTTSQASFPEVCRYAVQNHAASKTGRGLMMAQMRQRDAGNAA